MGVKELTGSSLLPLLPPLPTDVPILLHRAGGFAIQGMGGLLIKEIKGDFNNAVRPSLDPLSLLFD